MANLDKTIEKRIREIEESKRELKESLSRLEGFKEEEEALEKYRDEIEGSNEKYKELLEKKAQGLELTTDELKKLEEIKKIRKDYNDLLEKHNLREKVATEEIKKQTKTLKENFKLVKSGVEKIYNSVGAFMKPWTKASQAAADYAKKIGLSQKGMDNLRKGTIDFVNAQGIGRKYNKSIDELIKLQGNYASKVGRNISLTNQQRESLAAMSNVVGDDMATEFTAKLENFGLSATEAGNRMGKLFKDASQRGIVASAYAKNVVDNLNIAQNYTFKNGLKGLMSMAEKATAIKLNMSQAVAFAEKVNTVEGAIKTGAQLQVLGGPFAQFSNPMSMLYESLNDFEGLQDRITKMYGNLGKWSDEKGQVDVSSLNRMRMRQFAQATGMDYNNLMESVQATGKLNEISRRYGGQLNRLSKKDQDFIKNTASFNNETKSWGLSDKDGNFVSIDQLIGDKKKLQEVFEVNRSETEDIKEIAILLRGWDDFISGAKKQGEAGAAKATETLGVGKLIQTGVDTIAKNSTLITTAVFAREAMNLWSGFGDISKGRGLFGKGKGGMFAGARGGIFGTRHMSFHDRRIAVRQGNTLGNRIGNRIGLGKKATRMLSKDIALKGGLRQRAASGARLGGGLALAGLATDIAKDSFTTKGSFSNKALNVGSYALSGASAGAMIGSMIPLPVISQGVGAAVGAAIGGYLGHRNNVRNTQESKIANQGLQIQGNYTIKTLKKINEVLETGDLSKLRKKDIKRLKENNEYEQLVSFIKSKNNSYNGTMSADIDEASMNVTNLSINGTSFTNGDIKFAKGGLLNGPSHAEGGMKILGTNKSVEGGEFIVNRDSTRKYFNELSRINSDTTPVKPIEPLGKIMTVSEPQNNSSANVGVNNVKIEPINISLNGTIKLDTGGQKVDITESLLSNPVLIKTLTNMITKQINMIGNNGGFDKNNFKQKWS